MPSEKIQRLYDEYAKTRDPHDLLGQVRRTVNGEAVSNEQVEMMVAATIRYLELQTDDFVLDLCCGNGLLTDRVFEHCAGGTGVDMGAYLISIAQKNFGHLPSRSYIVSDIESFLEGEPAPERFTKALCYGSFAYLSDDSARFALATLRARFPRVSRAVLGNLPDKAKAREFFRPDAYVDGIEDDHETVIGRWRTKSDIEGLATETGWAVAFQTMPPGYYGALYRFDAILRPRL